MHHLAVKSNLFDSEPESNRLISGANDHPLCPKPRRLGPSMPEFLNPLRCSNHSERKTDPRSGVLNLIADKNFEERECICLPASYSCSSPARTGNPLVHDVQFEPFMPNKLLQ